MVSFIWQVLDSQQSPARNTNDVSWQFRDWRLLRCAGRRRCRHQGVLVVGQRANSPLTDPVDMDMSRRRGRGVPQRRIITAATDGPNHRLYGDPSPVDDGKWGAWGRAEWSGNSILLLLLCVNTVQECLSCGDCWYEMNNLYFTTSLVVTEIKRRV